MAKMTATEAARSFSDVLNRVAAGEAVEVTRSGALVAVVVPPSVRLMSAERFRDLIATAPPVDEDFAVEMRDLRATIEAPDPPWPS